MKYVLILLFFISTNLILCTNKNQKTIKTQSNKKYTTTTTSYNRNGYNGYNGYYDNSYYGNNYYSNGYYDDYYDNYYYDDYNYSTTHSHHAARNALIAVGVILFTFGIVVLILLCCCCQNIGNQDDNVIVKNNQSETPIFVDFNKNKIKLLLPNHKVNHIPTNFWTNGKNKGIKSFINQVFG